MSSCFGEGFIYWLTAKIIRNSKTKKVRVPWAGITVILAVQCCQNDQFFVGLQSKTLSSPARDPLEFSIGYLRLFFGGCWRFMTRNLRTGGRCKLGDSGGWTDFMNRGKFSKQAWGCWDASGTIISIITEMILEAALRDSLNRLEWNESFI